MKYAYLIVIGMLLVSCVSEDTGSTEGNADHKEQSNKPRYTSKVYLLQDVGWCYQIFKGSKIILNQKHIPAVQGIKGFETKEKAELAANFILERVNAGDERPSVTPEELDSIGAIDLINDFGPPPSMENPPPPPTELPINVPPPPSDEEVREEEYSEM
ncbi:MAG: DUF4907 domain-containing protein [Crocinitomicaceae bacterium]|nr:DUF4907 domain-containing protein [Crocinitomicaceae bacterium]